MRLRADAADHALLESLGDELKFVLITSAAALAKSAPGAALDIEVKPSTARKCERCWHWRDDVDADPTHPGLCGRCVANLYGTGEARRIA